MAGVAAGMAVAEEAGLQAAVAGVAEEEVLVEEAAVAAGKK